MGKKEEVRIIYNIGCPEWMLTFGDCMSLLLCFFVMLMTFSTPDESKLLEVIGGLQGALGVVEPVTINAKKLSMMRPTEKEEVEGNLNRGDPVQHKVDPESISPISLRDIKIKNKFNSFKDSIYGLGFKNIVTTQQIEDGFLVEMPFEKLFVADSDEMKPGSSRWMEPFAGLLVSMGNEVRLVAQLQHGSSVALARKRLNALCFILVSRYKIKQDRISIGIDFSNGKTEVPYLKALIADKLLSREISMADFFRNNGK